MSKLRKRLSLCMIDDDPMFRGMLRDHMENNLNVDIEEFETAEEMLDKSSHDHHVVILDYNLDSKVKNAMNGVQMLQELKERSPNTEVIMLSGQDKLDVAVDCMKYGAYDYVVKNESAFVRAENAVTNIGRQLWTLRQLKMNKRLIGVLLFGMAAIITFCLVIWIFYPELLTLKPTP